MKINWGEFILTRQRQGRSVGRSVVPSVSSSIPILWNGRTTSHSTLTARLGVMFPISDQADKENLRFLEEGYRFSNCYPNIVDKCAAREKYDVFVMVLIAKG